MRILSLVLLLLLSTNVEACIVIGDKGSQAVVMRNFDYPLGGKDGYGMLHHNPKGFMRQVIRIDKDDALLTWVSRHSSISINLLAPGTPQDGMNDAGLVGTMAVIHTRLHQIHPDPSVPTINEMEFLQYILDQAADIPEVVALITDTDQKLEPGSHIRVDSPRIRLTKITQLESDNGEVNFHWAFCDTTGLCAEVNYVSGAWEIDIMEAEELLMCNEDSDLLSLKYDRVSTDLLPIPQTGVNPNPALRYFNGRYFRSHPDKLRAEAVNDGDFTLGNGVSLAKRDEEELAARFHHLDRTTDAVWNKWQVVYHPKEMAFYYRTAAARKVKKVPVGELLKALEGNRTTTGTSIHTAFSGPVSAADFGPTKPKYWIRDVIAAMNQPPPFSERLWKHCYLHESLNQSGMDFDQYQAKMRMKNTVPLRSLAEGQPSWRAKLGVYAKIIASEGYYKLMGCNN